MTRTEERLADALAAAARAVPEESLRPLVVPERRERGQRGSARPGRPGWLAPVAAALGIALVIGLAVLASRLSGRSAGPTVGLPPGVPRYYVETGIRGGRPVVRSSATGRVTSTVPVPPGNVLGYNLSTADDNGTFFVVAPPPGGNQGERLYKFRLTQAGRVTGFSAVPVGVLAQANWAADALSVSPDGSWIAVAMSYTPRVGACGAGGQPTCVRPDYILAINLVTGARTVWRYTGDRSPHLFTVDSLSWTSDNHQLVFLGQACRSARIHQTCLGLPRTAEVRALNPATRGGLDTGRLLLRESTRFPYLVQALISPDGATITAVVLHGRGSTVVPGNLTVMSFSAATGQPLSVLYQRRLGGTAGPNTVPGVLALSQDATGQHFLLDIGLCSGNCTDGANGWIHDGRLVPLTPVNGREGDQAW